MCKFADIFYVSSFLGAPSLLKSDHGFESFNAGVANAALWMAHEPPEEALSRYERTYSVQNVDIESFWARLHDLCVGYWRKEFFDLEREGLWRGHCIDRWVLISIYLPLVQQDLTRAINIHNNFNIRKQPDKCRPGGRPNELYANPEQFTVKERGVNVPAERKGVAVTGAEVDHVRLLLGHTIGIGNLQDYSPPAFVPAEVEDAIRAQLNGRQVTRENARELYTEIRTLIYIIKNIDMDSVMIDSPPDDTDLFEEGYHDYDD